MMTLIGVELRRNFARRMYRVTMLLVSGVMLTASIIVFFNHSKDAPAVNVNRGPDREELVQMCAQGEGSFGPFHGPDADRLPPPGSIERRMMCERFIPPTIGGEYVALDDDRFSYAGLPGILLGITPTLVILSWVLASSFIGAEWRANTIGPLLTWEPRRIRLLLAKLFASMIVVIATALAAHVLLSLLLYPSAVFRGTTQGMDGAFWREVGGVVFRSTLLATLASVIGFAVGSIGRNTTAAVGIGFGYLAVLEGGILGGLLPWIRPWLLVGNAIVLASGERDFAIAGRTPIQAGVVLTCYAAAIAAVATTLFRRRDVA